MQDVCQYEDKKAKNKAKDIYQSTVFAYNLLLHERENHFNIHVLTDMHLYFHFSYT
jgi:hypothetical protein